MIKKIIIHQNEELLNRIANDKFSNETDKSKFIKKYLKVGYSHLIVVKKDQTELYKKKYNRVMR